MEARISISVKDLDHFFNMVNEIIRADSLHLLLLFDGTRTDDDEYVESLKTVQN